MRRAFPQALAIAMLLWALYPGNPYGYYVLLRWVCFGAFGYAALQAWEQQRQGWVWILGVTAGIYNPLLPVHMPRELWSVVNLVTIAIAAASAVALNREKSTESG